MQKAADCGFLITCPGTDLNRYDRCGSQDFKSCVSTNSTLRFKGFTEYLRQQMRQ